MKNHLIISLLLLSVLFCQKEYNANNLNEIDGVFYTKDTYKPYSGKVFSLYDNGNKESEWTLKDGKLDGLYTLWYKSGKKWLQNTYKDGGLVSQKCWAEDGNECECSDLGRGCK